MSKSHSTPEAIESHIQRNTGVLNPNYNKKQLDLYISKYGEAEGKIRWEQRNAKIAKTITGTKFSVERSKTHSEKTKGKLNVGSRFIINKNTLKLKRIPEVDIESFLLQNIDWKRGKKL